MIHLLAAKSFFFLLLLVLLTATATAKWPLRAAHRDAVPSTFDCLMRKAAYEYGKKLLPRRKDFLELYYALDLNLDVAMTDGDSDDCHLSLDSRESSTASSTATTSNTRRSLRQGEDVSEEEASPQEALPDDAVFVAPLPTNQASSNLNRLNRLAAYKGGSQQNPFYSVQEAVDYAVASTKSKHVVLRGGVHYLSQTILLTAKHSGLRLTAFPDESPVVSGGIPLHNIQEWKPYNRTRKVTATTDSADQNIWVTNLARTHPNLEIPGLQINGQRATRARYPNLPGGIESSCGYGCMINQGFAEWTPPKFDKYGYKVYFTDTNPNHTRPNGGWFEHYGVGIYGLCSVYDPPVSYWCSENPSGGGAFAFRTPTGLTPINSTILPNAPYDPTGAKDDAIVFVWRPQRWANWMFALDSYNATTGNMTFGQGGNQGARGENKGGDWFIENLLEELDHPNEFYYDKRTSDLYLWYNGTGPPPLDTDFVVPQLRTILNITGTQWSPATNIFVQGVTFRASRYTYMDPHGVPSAGDWALERNAAVYLQGTRHATINKCTMERLDGNGLMISGYNRNTTVHDCDFAYIGGTAIASWGFTNETDTDPGRPGIHLENAPFAGVDMTDGEHPRYNRIEGCTAREVGLYEKQSSFYMQAKTAYSTIRGNVFFNGPRAGINLNDGSAGGDEISHNLVFSTCRESGDRTKKLCISSMFLKCCHYLCSCYD